MFAVRSGGSRQIPLINEKKKAKKGSSYKNSGQLCIESLRVERRFSFLDFIQGDLRGGGGFGGGRGGELEMVVVDDWLLRVMVWSITHSVLCRWWWWWR